VVVGNPMQVDHLAAALAGNDMVLSLLGTRGLGATSVLADSVRATVLRWCAPACDPLVITSVSQY
jgi:hypothetical protein